jgi:hypothetical protein
MQLFVSHNEKVSPHALGALCHFLYVFQDKSLISAPGACFPGGVTRSGKQPVLFTIILNEKKTVDKLETLQVCLQSERQPFGSLIFKKITN